MKLCTIRYIFLLATFCLLSCSRHSVHWETLTQVETFIEEQPDSALVALQRIDAQELTNKEERAKYALLLSMAMDKNYIDITNDSLIHVATNYYSTFGDERHRMLSFYYLARVQYNMQAYAQSIISGSHAEQAATGIDDNYHLGLIYRCMSENYNQTYNALEELRYIRMARDCFERAGYDLHKQYAQLNTAKAYMGAGMLDEAELICEELLKDSGEAKDSTFLFYNLRLYAHILFLNDNFLNAKRVFNQLAIIQPQLSVDDYCYLAQIYNNEQKADSALLYLSKAKEVALEKADSVHIYRVLYEIALAKKDAETALTNYRKIIFLQDSVTKAILQQSVATAHRDYYQSEVILTAERATHEKQLLATCLLAICCISALTILYYREGNKRKEEELNRTIEAAHEATLIVNSQRKDLSIMQQRIDRLFGEQFITLEKLINTYLDHEGTSRNPMIIFREVETLITELSSPTKLHKLEDIVNENKNRIVARLREQLPSIKESDIQLFIYLCAGFSLRMIKLFMKEKLENIYNKKSRLKSKIQRSNVADKEDFLTYFS